MGREGNVTESERMSLIGSGGAMHVCGSGTTIAENTLSVDSLWFRVGKKSTSVN
jgi:hypothetical protein